MSHEACNAPDATSLYLWQGQLNLEVEVYLKPEEQVTGKTSCLVVVAVCTEFECLSLLGMFMLACLLWWFCLELWQHITSLSDIGQLSHCTSGRFLMVASRLECSIWGSQPLLTTKSIEHLQVQLSVFLWAAWGFCQIKVNWQRSVYNDYCINYI